MTNRWNKILFVLLACVAISVNALADRDSLPVTGFVVNSDDNIPLSDNMSVTINLYESCDDEVAVWTDTQATTFEDGLFGVLIDPPEALLDEDTLCLGLQIGDDTELMPRLEYSSVPFAMRADHAEVADVALSLDGDSLNDLVGSGLAVDGDSIELDTTHSNIWSGAQSYSSQLFISEEPSTTNSSDASLRVNPTAPVANAKLVAIQDNGTDRFTVDKEGDVIIAGDLTVSGTVNIAGLGDVTSVGAGNGLSGGGLTGALSLAVDETYAFNWTGSHSFATDVDLTFAGTENLTLTTDLAGSFTAFSIQGTPSATAGVTTGLAISQMDSANANGLDVGLWVDNADANLAMTTGIRVTGSSTGTVTTAIDASDTEVDTGIALGTNDVTVGGVTLSSTELSYLDGASSNIQTQINGIVAVAGDITSVVAGAGLTTGGVTGDVTVDVGAGNAITVNANDVAVTLNAVDEAELGASIAFADADLVSFASVNASSATEGLILPQAAVVTTSTAEGQIAWDSDNDTLYVGDGAAAVAISNPFGAAIDSGEITNNTVTGTDIDESSLVMTGLIDDDDLAAAAVDGGLNGEIADNSIDTNDLAATLTFADSDLLSFASVDASSTSEGLILPQAAVVTSSTAEGQITWDTDDDALYVGNGATATLIGTGDITGVTAGDGIQGGGASGAVTLDIDVSDFAGTGLEDDGSENLRIAAAAAGAGITGGAGSALDVGAGNAITVNANDVAVTLNAVDEAELAASIAFADADLVSFASVNGSSATEGLILPQAADVSASTAEGQISWDTNGDTLYIGDGVSALAIGANSGDITGVTAGAGLITGGSSGDVTVDVGAGTGITVNANDVAVNVDTAFGWTNNHTYTFAATEFLGINAAATDTTTTDGVLSMDIDAGNAAVNGIDIDLTQSNGAGAGVDASAIGITMTQSDSDADMFGIQIAAQGAAGAYVGAYEAGILIENYDMTAASMTNGILINGGGTPDVVQTGLTVLDATTGINVSDGNITNAINIGDNPIVTGNVGGTIGDVTTDSLTLTTDGTGDAEIALPAGSIGTTEILDATVGVDDIAAALSGAGLTGGAGSALAVGAGTGITVNADDVALNVDTAFAWTNSQTYTFAATEFLQIDAATTDSTTTGGVLDMNVDAGDAAVNALNIAITQQTASAAVDATGIELLMTGNDADGDMFGLKITGASTANAAAGTYEASIFIDNAEPTVASMTDGILITSSGINTGVTDGIDVSATNITNAINVGSNPIVTGNVAGTIGDATTDSWTFTTDGTGTAEIVLPLDSVSNTELDENGTFGWTANHTWTFTAAERLTVNAATTDTTLTTGVVDLNIDAGNAAVTGLDMAFAQSNGAAAAVDATAIYMLLTGNDADGDMFGIKITGASTATAAAGTYEAGIFIDNAEPTVASMTDGILITSSGIDTGVTDGIDVSAANITNAINVGVNPIVTGNVAGTIGDATTDSWTFTTDGTGDAEIALPSQSISSTEILDSTILTGDIFDGTIAGGDLSGSIAITSTGVQDYGGATSVEIPNAAAPTVDAAGEIAVDTTDDQLIYYGAAKRVIAYEQTRCTGIKQLAAADDNTDMGSFGDAVTLTSVWCTCKGTCNTAAQIALEDASGNAMTHTTPTCASWGTTPTAQTISAAGGLTAREFFAFDVTNTPDPETDTYSICVTYTVDEQ